MSQLKKTTVSYIFLPDKVVKCTVVNRALPFFLELNNTLMNCVSCSMTIAAKTYLPEEAELTVKEVRRGWGWAVLRRGGNVRKLNESRSVTPAAPSEACPYCKSGSP